MTFLAPYMIQAVNQIALLNITDYNKKLDLNNVVKNYIFSPPLWRCMILMAIYLLRIKIKIKIVIG